MIDPSIERIDAFRKDHGLDRNPETRRLWLAQLGGLIVPLPNFRWRREIIAQHDEHHLVTNYPTTLEGELSVAAWEVGARCYRDVRARLLCFALLTVGMLVQPRKTVAAFRAGQASARRS